MMSGAIHFQTIEERIDEVSFFIFYAALVRPTSAHREIALVQKLKDDGRYVVVLNDGSGEEKSIKPKNLIKELGK